MLSNRSTIFSPGWINLVFENTNQKYGAFVLRKMYRHMLGMAIIMITALVLAGASLAFLINNYLMDSIPETLFDSKGIVDLTPPPMVPQVEPVPSPEPPAPKQSRRSGIPVIVNNRTPVEPSETQSEPAFTEPSTGQEPAGPGQSAEPAIPGLELPVEPNKVFRVVEVNPVFPGGDQELIQYLRRHIRYPEDAKRKGINGTVNIEFTINSDGTVSDLYINSGIGGGCEEEAIRVVRNMPNWKPGRQSGIAVPVRLNLPIRFSLK